MKQITTESLKVDTELLKIFKLYTGSSSKLNISKAYKSMQSIVNNKQQANRDLTVSEMQKSMLVGFGESYEEACKYYEKSLKALAIYSEYNVKNLFVAIGKAMEEKGCRINNKINGGKNASHLEIKYRNGVGIFCRYLYNNEIENRLIGLELIERHYGSIELSMKDIENYSRACI